MSVKKNTISLVILLAMVCIALGEVVIPWQFMKSNLPRMFVGVGGYTNYPGETARCVRIEKRMVPCDKYQFQLYEIVFKFDDGTKLIMQLPVNNAVEFRGRWCD